MKVSRIMIFGFVVGILYLSYRYPFQINSSTTSPTYLDTPISLQISKYILFLFLYIIVFVNYFSKSNHPKILFIKNELTVFISLLLLTWGASIGLITLNLYMLQSTFFMGSIFIFLFLKDFSKVLFQFFLNYKIQFFLIFILVDFIQFLLFIFYNRLPALAYDNSISVRFGSIFDDPNGFAIFLLLFTFLHENTKNKFYKFFIIISIFTCLVLSQSITGIIIFLISYISVIMIRYFINREYLDFMRIILFFLNLFIITVLSWFYLKDFLLNFWELKSRSADEHLNSFSNIENTNLFNFLFGDNIGQVGESGYINILLNYGGIYLLIYFVLLVGVFLKFLNMLKYYKYDTNYLTTVSSFFSFFIGNSVAMVNLPLENVYPINMLYFMIIYMIIFYKK